MNTHAVLLALVALLVGSGSPSTGGIDQLLDDAREAVGFQDWDTSQDLRLAGQARFLGVEETFEADFARDGRFRLAFLGELTRRARFDGESVRLAEYSTLWHELEFFDREVELLRGLMHSGAWLGAEAALEEPTRAIVGGLGRYLETSAPSATGLLRALDFSPAEAREIVIVGDLADRATSALLREVYKRPLPGTVLALVAPGAPPENETWPLLAGRPMLDGKPTAYVCRKRLCDLPVDTPAQLSVQLDKLVSRVPAP